MGLDIYIIRKSRRQVNNTECEIKKKQLSSFRKVNCLIPFFKDWLMVQEIKNLTDYPIDKDSCLALVEAAKEVIEHPELAQRLLPTTTGFFFGSNLYDEYYFEDLKLIIDSFENLVIPEFDKLQEGDEIVFKIWY